MNLNLLYAKRLVVSILMAALLLLMTPASAQTTPILPLAEPGPYAVGIQIMSFVDTSRDGRTLMTNLWYPAIAPETPTKQQKLMSNSGWLNATPVHKAAPYPLIIASPGFAGSISPIAMLLASRGFAVVGMLHPQDYVQTTLVDRPLDILFVLDQLETLATGDLAGLIDTKHSGVLGHATGAYTALAVTGARINSASDRMWVTTSGLKPINWDELTAYRTKHSPLPPGALWPAFSDKRIKAALLLELCDVSLFAEAGLASATVPSLIVSGTADPFCLYEQNGAYAYKYMGSQNRFLLTVVNGSHLQAFNSSFSGIVHQFAAAFFGLYLQDQQNDAQYLTAKYVDNAEAQLKLGLTWGLYNGQKGQ